MKRIYRARRVFLPAGLLLCLCLFITGCPQTDYGVDGCSRDDPPVVENFWKGPGMTDVTFFAFGDAQFGGGAEDKNQLHVRAINAAEDLLSWDSAHFGVDEPVSRVRGVIIAGDLTQNGRDGRTFSDNEYGAFTSLYGVCGNREILYPVYEGYGNHDYFIWENIGYRIPGEHPVADSVSVRNDYRAGLVNTAPGTDGHYSWEWDGIHFVNLNLVPSDVDPGREIPGDRDPRAALTFLEGDLAEHVLGTDKRVVVFTHYGFYSSWDFDGWWTEEEAADYYDVIRDYDVIAHLHGHAHQTGTYTWNGIRILNLGTPYYTSYNSDERGHFTVIRITDDKLCAGDASWNPENPDGDIIFPAFWHIAIDLS